MGAMRSSVNIEKDLGNVEIIPLKTGEWYEIDGVTVCYQVTLLVDGRIVLAFIDVQGLHILKTVKTEAFSKVEK